MSTRAESPSTGFVVRWAMVHRHVYAVHESHWAVSLCRRVKDRRVANPGDVALVSDDWCGLVDVARQGSICPTCRKRIEKLTRGKGV